MNKLVFPRYILLFLLAACAPCAFTAESDSTPKPAEPSPGAISLSAKVPTRRARWQEHFTLGPGDVLNVSLFDTPDTARTEVPISPDGRITFLQARDVTAAGLTVDELRDKLDEILGKFYTTPRSIVTPAAIHSKHYYVLGAVVNKGVFSLDRPLTVIEALARAGGLETGLYNLRPVELADLSHSFLSRNGQRLPVDFEKLFQHGDLSQNIPIEPEDYLYFALAVSNEIYVLGEVLNPGVLAFAPKPTVLKAIAARGGYSQKAFKRRVLVVRGSLNHPDLHVIDTAAILAGNAPDFALQYKDIVYVSTSPWVLAAEVLDNAAKSFVQSLIVEGSTLRVPAAIK